MRLVDIDHFMDVAAGYIGRDLYKLIEAEPTIDPVKHGKWVIPPEDREIPEGYIPGEIFICSECGKGFVSADETWIFHYCPRCGASMDEDG